MPLDDLLTRHRARPACRNCGDAQFFSHELCAGASMAARLLPGGLLTGAKYKLQVCGICGLTDLYVPPELLDGVRRCFKPEGGWPT